MNNIFSEYEGSKFIPCNFSGLMNIADRIAKDEELYGYIKKNQFDSLEISWSGIFLHSVYHDFKTVDWNEYNERMNSLLFCSLDNQTMQLMWIIFSICHGQYELALRELRNAIESSFLFYRIDHQQENRLLSGFEKFQIIDNLPQNECYGKPVFRLSNYGDWESAYDNIYKPLCEYTHTKKSVELCNEAYPEYQMKQPIFDRDKIMLSLHYFQKVLLVEMNMMKTQLSEVYSIDSNITYDGVLDAVSIPLP